ncbi:MAG: DUF3467 domain-containing protein [Bacteroidia bacterium]|nr:DUF3467 domain-containing protein [Bacteroidia bacterium]MCX7764456.1 DUF3467 domain-containing protein [Bacteroidia bacterium]MDW8057062.1 DUF3467 domain-containing protein [Bacteroidia bacterium]
MNPEAPQEGTMLNVELTDDVAGGIYSNLAIISHTPSEFVIDFLQVLPGLPKARVRSRVILSPYHYKRLLLAMQDNLQKYESRFGEISVQDDWMPPVALGGPGLA